jgi:hypothetical protein
MNLLRDIITYIRRIIKTPSDASISDFLIIDYINRFWLIDVDARMQLFDLKTKYSFQTQPGVDRYNMPLYDPQLQPDGNIPPTTDALIASFPVYQGFLEPVYVNGVQVPLYTQRNNFFNPWQNIVQYNQAVAVGNGTTGPYTLPVPIIGGAVPPNPPFNGLLRGHIDITGIISTGDNIDPPIVATFFDDIPHTSVDPAVWITSIDGSGNNVVVTDSGQFLETNVNYGLLMKPGNAPLGDTALPGGYSLTSNTINYFTGVSTVTFPVAIPVGKNINVQCYFFETGLPRAILYYNNVLTLRSPPDKQYLVELDAYLTPAAFLDTSSAIPFAYMAEYIARGAARKILSDTGDFEQFQFYEPLFREQENLVWKRSQRQFTATRTETIYSQNNNGNDNSFGNNFGGNS